MTGMGVMAAAVLIAVVVAGPLMGTAARYGLGRNDAAIARQESLLDRVFVAVFLSMSVVAVVGVAWTRPAGSLAAVAGLDAPILAGAADAVLAVMAVELGLSGFNRAVDPLVRGTRGPEYEYPQRNRRTLRFVRVGALLAVALLVTVPQVDPGVVGTGLSALVVVVGMRVALFGAVENGGRFVRLPTDDERARIEGCCERFGVSPARIVLYTGDRHDTEVYHGGFGDGRTVRLPEQLLEVGDDALAVALAQAEGKCRNRQRLFAQLMPLAAVMAVLCLVSAMFAVLDTGIGQALGGVVGLVAIAGVAAVGFGVTNRLARRRVFAADDFASERLGAETVRDAYHRHGAAVSLMDQNVDPGESSLGRRLRFEPAMLDRIARLDAPPREDDPAFLENDPERRDSDGQTPPQDRAPPRESSGGQPPDRQPAAAGEPTPRGQGRPPRDGRSDPVGEGPAENPHAPPNRGAGGPPPERGRGRPAGEPAPNDERGGPQNQQGRAGRQPRDAPRNQRAGSEHPARQPPGGRGDQRRNAHREQPAPAGGTSPPPQQSPAGSTEHNRRGDPRGQRQRARDEPRRGSGSKWWVLTTAQLWLLFVTIGLAVAVEFLGSVGVLSLVDTVVLGDQVTYYGALAILLATFVVPIGVYRERDGAMPHEWRPSAVYYLAAVPFLGALVGLVYLIRRAQN